VWVDCSHVSVLATESAVRWPVWWLSIVTPLSSVVTRFLHIIMAQSAEAMLSKSSISHNQLYVRLLTRTAMFQTVYHGKHIRPSSIGFENSSCPSCFVVSNKIIEMKLWCAYFEPRNYQSRFKIVFNGTTPNHGLIKTLFPMGSLSVFRFCTT
jgi:hypothetical protein